MLQGRGEFGFFPIRLDTKNPYNFKLGKKSYPLAGGATYILPFPFMDKEASKVCMCELQVISDPVFWPKDLKEVGINETDIRDKTYFQSVLAGFGYDSEFVAYALDTVKKDHDIIQDLNAVSNLGKGFCDLTFSEAFHRCTKIYIKRMEDMIGREL